MVGLRVVRKIINGGFGFPGFSALSRRWNSSTHCVIRGTKQDITLDSTYFVPLDEYESQVPLVTKIPLGGLINVDPARSDLFNDQWRPILFSAFLHSHFCKSAKDCVVKAYEFKNLGVLTDLNVLAFKKLDRVQGSTNCNHMEYCAFVEDLFKRFCGVSGSNLKRQFPECADFLYACTEGHKDEEVLRYNTFFLQAEELANFYSDNHRLLRQELKHRSKKYEAGNILRELNNCYSNTHVVLECENNILLEHLLGSHGRKPLQQGGQVPTTQPSQQAGHMPTVQQSGGLLQTAQAGSVRMIPVNQGGGLVQTTNTGQCGGGFPGSALVDMCRIAVQHAIEDNLLKKVRAMYPATMYPQENYLFNKYTRVDLIWAVRYLFEKYPGEALYLFKKYQVLEHLKMERRLPTPSIYNYAYTSRAPSEPNLRSST